MESGVPRADPGSSAPTGQEQPPVSAVLQLQQEQAVAHGARRLHPSDRPTGPAAASASASAAEDTTPGDAPSPSQRRRTLTGVSPQRGSSRDSATMQRSASPEGDASGIKYTRTGRVSKALKGQRVHHCEECGKTYTRKEHLRRHQQNHKPGAFPCDIPGCNRSFNREDLLLRHKARHNDPHDPPTRRGSIGSSNSGPGSDSNIPAPLHAPLPTSLPQRAPSAFMSNTQPIPPTSQSGSAAQSGQGRYYPTLFRQPQPLGNFLDPLSLTRKDYIPITELQRVSQSLSVLTSGSDPYHTAYEYDPWGGSPSHSSGGYDSPTQGYPFGSGGRPYYQPHPGTSQHLEATYPEYGYQGPTTSRSPVSASSSNAPYGQWHGSTQTQAFSQIGPVETFPGAAGIYMQPMHDSRLSIHVAQDVMADARDQEERDELSTPTTAPQSFHEFDSSLDESTYATERRYLESFWRAIHPHFPVAHRPTFNITHTSPLLRAAIFALGAQAQGSPTDVKNGRLLHERCSRVLKKRTAANRHTFRIVDMQAIVLVEIYAIFKARRPPLAFSRPFENVYRFLVSDPDAITKDDGLVGHALGDLNWGLLAGNDKECKQRLLATCHILDYQNSALFGRQRLPLLAESGMDLLLPRYLDFWDDPENHSRPAIGVKDTLESVAALAEPAEGQHDPFQSMLLLICAADDTNQNSITDLIGADYPGTSPLLHVIEDSTRARLAFHTIMLTKFTPTRDLLAVAGESWVMSEKLANEAEFKRSQQAVSSWIAEASQQQAGYGITHVRHALHHAFAILSIHSELKARTSLLFQEWSLYLAAITVWAFAYTTSDAVPAGHQRRPSRPRLSIPSPTELRMSPAELEQAVNAFVQAGPTALFGRKEAKNVLMWAKSSIEAVDVPHSCGVTNGALDVLGKLVTRGHEDGWLG